MPSKKAAVAAVNSEPRCILQFGRENNVIEWREAMYNIASGLYGTTGMFFNLSRSYRFPPIPLRSCHPNFLDQPAAAEGAAADGEDEEDGVALDGKRKRGISCFEFKIFKSKSLKDFSQVHEKLCLAPAIYNAIVEIHLATAVYETVKDRYHHLLLKVRGGTTRAKR